MCFVSSLNDLLHQVLHKCKTSKLSGGMNKVGHDSGVIIKLPYISKYFQQLAVDSIGSVVNFMNALTLLQSWLTIYPLLASKNADMSIL